MPGEIVNLGVTRHVSPANRLKLLVRASMLVEVSNCAEAESTCSSRKLAIGLPPTWLRLVSPRAKPKDPDWPPRKIAEFCANRSSPPKEMVCFPLVIDTASLVLYAGASYRRTL